MLLAFPNVSEGRDPDTVHALRDAWAPARVLDVHADPDHDRTAITLAGAPGALARALVGGARVALARIDIGAHTGEHPFVGALDVAAPVVYRDPADRGAACAEALVAADTLGADLDLPVFLYGELAGRTHARRAPRGRARRPGAPDGQRRAAARLRPGRLHPTGGATLVAARPPLVAFNLSSSRRRRRSRTPAHRRRDHPRGGRDGLPGVRALGLELGDRVAGVDERRGPTAVTLAEVVEAGARHAAGRRGPSWSGWRHERPDGFPSDVPLRTTGHILEDALSGPGLI